MFEAMHVGTAVDQPQILIEDADSAVPSRRSPRSGRQIVIFIGTVQAILILAHWFIYKTWVLFHEPAATNAAFGIGVGLLSVSFVAASLLVHRYSNVATRLFYTLASLWLGALNFLFVAACLCWMVVLGGQLAGFRPGRAGLADIAYATAVLVAVYGVVNARWVRIRKVSVRLPNLPRAWRGRRAALVSDVHLGPINGTGFMRRIVSLLARQKPDVIFIAGDLFDGTKVQPDALIAPWKDLTPPFGIYFATGNHEEFGDSTPYLQAITRAGIRVLNNRKDTIDGLQVIGINDRDLARPNSVRKILESAELDSRRASILLAHTPHQISIAEEAGISMQLSGHTHAGQIFPFTWFTRRIFRQFTYGVQRCKEMLVYTSSGAGTWGPPMRVATRPEVVLIEFA